VGYLLLLAIFLFAPLTNALQDVVVGGNQLPSTPGAATPSVYAVTSADIEAGKQAIVDAINQNNDANVQALDNRVAAYMSNQTQKIVIGAIGVNILVAGLVYYFLNKKTKDLTFQSVAMKRKKDDEDRAFMADSINDMRSRMEKLDDYMRSVVQPSLLTLEELSNQRRMNDGRPVYTGGGQWGQPGGAPNQQEYGQQYAMARPENVQGSQQAQGWVPDGNQYEQPNSGYGWDGATYYQGYQ